MPIKYVNITWSNISLIFNISIYRLSIFMYYEYKNV